MQSVFVWLSRCPLWLLHSLGALLGWLTFWLSPSYRRRFKENSRLAGVEHAARPAVAHAGRLLMELPFLWLREAGQPIRPRLTWEGADLIADAHAQGRGVLLLTPHMGSFEVAAQAYAERFSDTFGAITVLYRPARKAWVRRLMDNSRARPGVSTAPATLAGVRQMLRALRRGETVGLLPDQVPPEGMGVWAPFFGKPAYTMTLAARLVQQTGAVPLLIWGERLPWGRGYTVRVSAFDEEIPPSSAAAEAAAAVINRAMERLIRQCPQQYLWSYDRYKSGPVIAQEAQEDSAASNPVSKG